MTSHSMSQQSTDKDSLIALDALLNIGSSAVPRGAGGFGSNNVGSQVVERNLKPLMGAGFSTVQLSAISAMLSLNASLGCLPPSGSLAYNQLIAARAAAATIQSQNSYSMVASTGFGNGLIQSTAGNHSTARPESRNDEKRVLLPSSGDGGTRMVTSTTEKNNPANKEQVFRQEKVEAALRSKAQRGRKRDNLSVSERLELTRTRNREHAKCTRVRKKARYQELLDCEQKLLDITQNDDLKSKRQQSVKNFLSIRECMIQHFGSSRSGKDDKSSISGVEAKTGERGSVQFITTCNLCDEGDYPTLPREVVESFDEFRYNASELDPILSAQFFETQSSLYNMKLWDEIITSRVERCFGGDVCRSLAYKVNGDLDGIAISNADNGFVHVDLVLNVNGGGTRVLSGIMTVHFAPGSSRLHSAVWTTTADNISNNMRQDDSVPLPETLGNQRVYPSNVSLDHDKASEPEEAESPGMNI